MIGTLLYGLRIFAVANVRLTILCLIILVVVPVGSQAFAQGELDTIEPGKITVAFNGDLPMTSVQNGEIVGTDGEMIALIGEQLGLEIVPQQMDWSSAIAATSAGRVDLLLGAVGWTEQRTEVMLLSDPLYYFGTLLAQKTGTSYHTFADMAGKKVGTVVGFSLVDELKGVPGISEVRLYDTSDGVMRDLVAGRLDIAILDPPFVALAIKEHPEWDLHQVALDPDPDYPIMSTRYNATMAIRKDGTALAEAIDAEIAILWSTCENQTILAAYGVTDPSFFLPPVPNPRVGVDRPEGWKSPILNPTCDANAEGVVSPAP